MITPILWLALLHTLLICTSKLRPQSIAKPRSFKFSIHILSPRVTLLFRMLIVWYFFSGFPEGDSNHTNWSQRWHSPKVWQVQHTSLVLSHRFEISPRTLIAQNPRCMKDCSEICSTIVALTMIPEDSYVPHFSMSWLPTQCAQVVAQVTAQQIQYSVLETVSF